MLVLPGGAQTCGFMWQEFHLCRPPLEAFTESVHYSSVDLIGYNGSL
jgi:hypothetical protein